MLEAAQVWRARASRGNPAHSQPCVIYVVAVSVLSHDSIRFVSVASNGLIRDYVSSLEPYGIF